MTPAVLHAFSAVRAIGTETIKPDPAVQEKIREVAAAVRESEQGRDGSLEIYRAIIALNRATRDNQADLIRQLIWYVSQPTDEPGALAFPVIIGSIAIPKTAMVEAIAPLIRRTQDAKLTEGVQLVAKSIENASLSRPPDFSYYQSYIDGKRRQQLDIEPGLAAYMFERSPGDALQVFALSAYKDERVKPLLWARHVVDDVLWKRQYGFVPRKQPDPAVTGELDKMAARDEWWARLYAAEIIRQHPEFGTVELIERLRGDSHPLVKEMATAIQPKS